MAKLYNLTIKEASDLLAKKEITSTELTRSVFERIEEVEPKVGSYITLCQEEALKMAKESDSRYQKGKALSQIDGIPIAVKDLYLTKGVRTTAASKMLEDFIAPYESTVTKKLKEAGAIMIGKVNLDQFALGSSTESSYFKTAKEYNSTTRNPWDLERIPGGSSGGSAAAVAASECLAALGTDTGGSIRQPASHCSVTGLKPTYGRVSRYGIIAMASSLDQAGPMTKTVEDAAIMLKYMAGFDQNDSTSSEKEVPDYNANLKADVKGLKIGIPKEFFGQGLDRRVKDKIMEAVSVLEKLGAEVIDVSIPSVDHALSVYYIIMPAELSSNLARFDGIHYGTSVLKNPNFQATLNEVYEKSRKLGFGDEAQRRIMLGSYVLSAGYYDAYYKRALKVRTLIKKEFEEVFKKVDVLATPTSPVLPFRFGEKSDNPLEMYLSDVLTVPINPAGVPAMTIPAGFAEENNKNLPIGLQLIGPAFSEQTLFNVGYTFQKNTDHHLKQPTI